MNTGYKVVSADLKSYMHRWLGEYTIQYKIGEWVKSWSGTPLMYFADQSSLNRFIDVEDLDLNEYCIYIVQARYPFKNKYSYGISDISKYIEATKKHKKYKPNWYTPGFPDGTKFCKEIKLLERVM